MKHQPRNRIWSPYHDDAYDFRVVAEFTQRFPQLQFLWFCRHTSETVGDQPFPSTLHSVKFRTDRDGLRTFGIPRPKRNRTHDHDYVFGHGAPVWSWRIDARCRLPYVVQFWMMNEGCGNRPERFLPESHPLGWLVPSRLESTPFAGDLDSLVWGESFPLAA